MKKCYVTKEQEHLIFHRKILGPAALCAELIFMFLILIFLLFLFFSVLFPIIKTVIYTEHLSIAILVQYLEPVRYFFFVSSRTCMSVQNVHVYMYARENVY